MASSQSDSAPSGGNNGQEAASSTPSNGPFPTLPAPPGKGDGETTKLDVSGEGTTVRFDHLGPIVVHKDGTMSRIGNWAEMSEIERKNTLRIIGKRNQLRLSALRGEDGGAAKDPEHAASEEKEEGGK